MPDDAPTQDLQQLREDIESIDRDLMDAMKRRMELSERIAAAKINAAYPFRDQSREEQVIQRIRTIAADLSLDPHQIESLYRRIMQMSITHQQAYIKNLEHAPLRVAYQGVEGAYSHLTAQKTYAALPGGVLLTGFESFRAASESVLKGENDLALLPIENSTAGSINETYDLLAEGHLTINAEVVSRIQHHLLAQPGAKLDEIRSVISHPQALRQCQRFLESHPNMTAREEFDTAGSARKVKEANDPTLAAIASESAARLFGLQILAASIQTQAGNFTRFVEVGREASTCPPDQPCKTSLTLVTGHQPGDLAAVLTAFAKRGLNLTKLESRPMPETPFRYRFYLDLDQHAESASVVEALQVIQENTREVRILGTYAAAETEPEEPLAASDSPDPRSR